MPHQRTPRTARPRLRAARRAVCAAAVLALTVTGCLADDDDDTGQAAAPPEPERSQPADGTDEDDGVAEEHDGTADDPAPDPGPQDGADTGEEDTDGDAPPAADDAGDHPGSDSAVADPTGTWRIASVTVDGETVEASTEVTGVLAFDGDGGLSLQACNVTSGTAEPADGGALTPERGMGTLMACPGLQGQLENATLAFLDGEALPTGGEAELTLTKENGDQLVLVAH